MTFKRFLALAVLSLSAISGTAATSAYVQSEGMRSLTGTKPASERTGAPYVFESGPKVVVAEGEKGDIMFSGLLGYAYTGTIANDAISNRGLVIGPTRLHKGQFVYGVPMANADRRGRATTKPQIFWCTPVNKDENEWQATCINSEGLMPTVNERGSPAFMVQQVLGGWRRTEPITVSEQPIAPPIPVSVRYEFRGWGKRSLTIRIYSGPSGSGQDFFDTKLPRSKNGSALVRLGGGLYEIRQTADSGYAIVVLDAPTPRGAAIPKAAVTAVRS